MRDAIVLKEALPYIRRFRGKTFIIKTGGEVAGDADMLASLAQDISLLYQVGMKVVLVHGGGPQVTNLSKQLGLEPKMIAGRRITDDEVLEVAKMVFAGKISTEILSALRKEGTPAVGFSGVAGNIIQAVRRPVRKMRDEKTGEMVEVDFGHVGDVIAVDVRLLRVLLESDYLPVLSCLGADDEGHVFNINADTIATEIAKAFPADKLILLSSVPGVLSDPDDPGTLISELTVAEARARMADGTIKGGMTAKLENLIEAIEAGIKQVHLLDGRRPHSLLLEIFTVGGTGTMVVP